MSRSLLLFILAALPLLSCGPAAAPVPFTRLCPTAVYAPTGERVPLNVQLEWRMSSLYALRSSCVVLDGASLAMPDVTGGAVTQRVGELHPRWTADISRDGPHELKLIVWLRGTGDFDAYRFIVQAHHEFVLTGTEPPALTVVLSERPGERRLERRPMVEWHPNAGMAQPPGWKPPAGSKPAEL